MDIRHFIENSPDEYMVDIRRRSGQITSFPIKDLKAELRDPECTQCGKMFIPVPKPGVTYRHNDTELPKRLRHGQQSYGGTD